MADELLTMQVKNLDEVNDYLKKLPEDSFDDAKLIFRKAVLAADKKVKLRFSSLVIKSRTGNLMRSLRTSVTGTTLKTLRASFYSAANVAGIEVKYAAMQELGSEAMLGGPIRAKNAYKNMPGGPYLNIPVFSNLTPAGVMRKSAKMLFDEGAHIHKSKAGNWGVFLGSKMMMVLKKEVTIPARLGMVDAANDQIPTILSGLRDLIGED